MELEDSILICPYYRYYGEILQDMKKYGEALELYDQYLEKYPNFPDEDILNEKEKILKLLKE